MDKLFKSRKFWMTLIGVITVILIESVGLTPEKADFLAKTVATMFATYVGAQGLADFGKEKQ